MSDRVVMGTEGDTFTGLSDLGLESRHWFRLPIVALPDGSHLSIPINVLVGASRTPVLLAVAAHHGDEHEGPTALINIWEGLEPAGVEGSLVIVPVLNPPAFRAVKRWSDEDLVDINRIFPGTPDGTVTHRIARAFMDKVVSQADFILSMHGWSAGYLVEPYTEFPRSGPTVRASLEGALAFGLPHLNPLDAGPGRLMTEASRMGVPLIEVEIGGQGSTLANGRTLYEAGIRNLMRHLAMLPRTRVDEPSPHYVDRLECFAPTGGLSKPEVEVGEAVEQGQPLTVIYDLNLRRQAVVESPSSGVVGVLRVSASMLPGQLAATVFKNIDWAPPEASN